MPWLATDTMKERTKFVLKWEERFNEAEGGRVNLAELCRVFGISRQTGYEWIGRYRETGRIDSLVDRSRRPLSSPSKVNEKIEASVVAARKQRPTWGARKLRHTLVERYPDTEWPSASCMTAILDRHGLTTKRRKRRKTPVAVKLPFAQCDRPNAVWCIDFKGKFRTRDGTWCHVLTLVDAYSRFLLRAEVLIEPTGKNVERILDAAFQEFGLPTAMRSDNGPPFASTGAGGLTELSVWWLRLGLRLERIQPGKPYQNGRLERLHLTLEEVVGTPSASPRAQQRAIDLWRRDYNEHRPHDALGMRCPVEIYARSHRRYPCKLIDSRDESHEGGQDVYRLDKSGRLRWNGRWIHISSALAYEFVAVENASDDWTRLAVNFGGLHLGTFDREHPERGFRVPRRRRGKPGNVSILSLA
jgi:transposase InsO family protein